MAAQAGLNLNWSQTPEDTFSFDRAHLQVMQVGLGKQATLEAHRRCIDHMSAEVTCVLKQQVKSIHIKRTPL